jgi:hypothetical protein
MASRQPMLETVGSPSIKRASQAGAAGNTLAVFSANLDKSVGSSKGWSAPPRGLITVAESFSPS